MLTALLILAAIAFPLVQVTFITLSTGFQERGLPPIARIDFTVTEHVDRIPQDIRVSYGFFLTIGLVGICCFAAGRLSHAAPLRNPTVASRRC